MRHLNSMLTSSPEFSLQVEYDPRVISFRRLLEVFWSSHDSRQVFGQGPDVGNQYRYKIMTKTSGLLFNVINLFPYGICYIYRSIIFTNGTEEARLAAVSKEKEQLRSRISIVTTQIQQLVAFYPAEPEHQVFMVFLFYVSLSIFCLEFVAGRRSFNS